MSLPNERIAERFDYYRELVRLNLDSERGGVLLSEIMRILSQRLVPLGKRWERNRDGSFLQYLISRNDVFRVIRRTDGDHQIRLVSMNFPKPRFSPLEEYPTERYRRRRRRRSRSRSPPPNQRRRNRSPFRDFRRRSRSPIRRRSRSPPRRSRSPRRRSRTPPRRRDRSRTPPRRSRTPPSPYRGRGRGRRRGGNRRRRFVPDRHIRRNSDRSYFSSQPIGVPRERTGPRPKPPVMKEVECPICLDDLSLDYFHSYCNCGHRVCRECAAEDVKEKINSSQFPLKCPIVQCEREINQYDLGMLMEEDYWVKFMKFSLNFFVRRNEGYTRCLSNGCDCVFYHENGRTYFFCERCKQEYCLKCQTRWHSGQTCEEYDEKKLDEEFLQMCKENKYQRCPKCHAMVEKIDGCDHINCTCGAEFCYFCGTANWESCDHEEERYRLENNMGRGRRGRGRGRFYRGRGLRGRARGRWVRGRGGRPYYGRRGGRGRERGRGRGRGRERERGRERGRGGERGRGRGRGRGGYRRRYDDEYPHRRRRIEEPREEVEEEEKEGETPAVTQVEEPTEEKRESPKYERYERKSPEYTRYVPPENEEEEKEEEEEKDLVGMIMDEDDEMVGDESILTTPIPSPRPILYTVEVRFDYSKPTNKNEIDDENSKKANQLDVKEGDVLYVLNDFTDWLHVRTSKGRIGYVPSNYTWRKRE